MVEQKIGAAQGAETNPEKKDSVLSHSLRWYLYIVFAIILIDTFGMLMALVLPAIQHYRYGPGIEVTLHNDGAETLHSVTLHYAGGPDKLGDIQPGQFDSTVIRPGGESHLEIEFADHLGKITQFNAGGNLDQHYRGSIKVSIRDGAIDKNEQNVWLHGSRDSD